jgi:hypothetical protein
VANRWGEAEAIVTLKRSLSPDKNTPVQTRQKIIFATWDVELKIK